MNRLLSFVILLFLGVCSYLRASAQPGGEHAFFRMERVQSGEATCVLVREDGNYRLEKLFRAKTEIYTGSLDSARVEQIKALLASEQLRKMAQEDIQRPLVTETFDTLQLDIWRDRAWQTLVFFSPDSRKAFKESLDPLLHWFGGLQKRRTATRTEGPATRCLPKTATQPAVPRETPSGAGPAATGGRAQFLFRLHSSHFYEGNAESSCTIVFGDGSYHWEHSAQDYRVRSQGRHGKIADGKLQSGSIQELQEILGAPDLESSPGNPDVGGLPPFQDGTFTTLSIPRGNQVRNLIFSSFFNTLNNPSEPGGKSNMRYRVTDEKVIKPLRKWIKNNIDTNRRGIEKAGAGNDCGPV